jgi:hypothetical protein
LIKINEYSFKRNYFGKRNYTNIRRFHDHTIKEWDECYHSKHGAIQKLSMFYKKWSFLI